jgi:hypothetical protein
MEINFKSIILNESEIEKVMSCWAGLGGVTTIGRVAFRDTCDRMTPFVIGSHCPLVMY